MNKKPVLKIIFGILISVLSVSACTHKSKKITQYKLEDEQKYNSYTVKIYREKEIVADGFIQIFKGNKLVYTEDGYVFKIGLIDEELSENSLVKIGQDITGDGEPNLVVSHWSGGIHGLFDFYIFSIGKKFKLLDKIEAESGYSSKFKDADNDGALEFLGFDETFSYWNTCYADSPAPDIILKYKNGKYRLDLELMKRPLPSRAEEEKIIKEIQSDMKSNKETFKLNSSGWNGIYMSPKVWGYMLDLIYTGHSKEAWAFPSKIWPKGKSGQKEFISDFKKQLSDSPYWNIIKERLS